MLGVSLMDGWALTMSALEARWVTAIARAAPDMPPLLVRRAARLYMLEMEQDADTLALDRLLAVGRGVERPRKPLRIPWAFRALPSRPLGEPRPLALGE